MGQCDVNETVQAGGQAALDGPLSAPTPATEPKGKARGKGPTAAKKTASPSMRPPPHAKQMMDLAEQHRAELFSFAGDSFAAVDINNRRATLRIESTEFAKLLRCWLYEAQQTVASAQAVAEAQATLAARARYTGLEQPVYLRTGKAGDALYLDLGTADGQAVKVTPQGWRVIPRPPVHFLRPAGMQPLPMPVRGGNLAELFTFINTPEDCQPLLLAWLMFALSPDGPFPLLAVHGEQGNRGQGSEQGVRIEKIQRTALVFKVWPNGDALNDVAQHQPQQPGNEHTGSGIVDIPYQPPPAHGFFAAKLDADGPENQSGQQQHERHVEGREHGRIHYWKPREQGPAANDQPDFIAVPNRADGIQRNATAFFLAEKQMQRARTQVEAIQNRIAAEDRADDEEPPGGKFDTEESVHVFIDLQLFHHRIVPLAPLVPFMLVCHTVFYFFIQQIHKQQKQQHIDPGEQQQGKPDLLGCHGF